ncbi:MAG: glycosyltransferase family 4 protein [Planctomycetes bacterium]|nr:glycosyltransferase family 4 protein [Planctomycetota bacterium]
MAEAPVEAPGVVVVSGPLDYRGSVLHTLQLCRGLRARGLDLRVVTPGGPLEGRFAAGGVPLAVGGFLASRWVDSLRRARFLAQAAEGRPSLVHAQGLGVLALAESIAARSLAPLVVTVHDYPGGPRRVALSPSTRAVITVSEDLRQDLVNRGGVPKGWIRVIPDGVDREAFPLPLARTLPEGGLPVVGVLGRLEPVRGHRFFLDAAAELTQRGVEALYLIAGQGSEAGTLRAQAARLGLERRVTFVGHVTDSREVLGALDVAVVPSTREGFGQILLETMAAGVPVAASGVGGILDLIKDEETGLVVPPRDPGALADAVARLLAEPDLAARMAQRARALVLERYEAKPAVEATLALYRAVRDGREPEEA